MFLQSSLFTYFKKPLSYAYVVSVSSVFSFSLLGCQPNPNDSVAETTVNTELEASHDTSQKKHDQYAHDEHAHDEHAHDTNRIMLTCESNKSLAVFYHKDTQPHTAHLMLDGIEYELTETESDTFITSFGLEDAQGMMWQVKGANAVLSTFPLEYLKSPTTTKGHQHMLKPLYTCHIDNPV